MMQEISSTVEKVTKEKFIEYLKEYQRSKISRKDFFKTNGKVIVNSGFRFKLDKDELNFENYNFKEIDLSNMVLKIILTGFVYGTFNLEKSNLSNIDLSNANLSLVHLSNADLSNANLSNANLTSAYLSNSNLSSANVSDANLSDVDLSSANISNTKLSKLDESNHIIIESLYINTENTNFQDAGKCSDLDDYHKICLKKRTNCVIIFIQNGNIQIPLGVLKFLGNKSFLCIQNVNINGDNYNRGFCYLIEQRLFDRIKQTTIEENKIYKCVVNELHLQVLRPINPKEIYSFYRLMDSLLRDIENDNINFEKIVFN